jgi:hypothetical protein
MLSLACVKVEGSSISILSEMHEICSILNVVARWKACALAGQYFSSSQNAHNPQDIHKVTANGTTSESPAKKEADISNLRQHDHRKVKGIKSAESAQATNDQDIKTVSTH